MGGSPVPAQTMETTTAATTAATKQQPHSNNTKNNKWNTNAAAKTSKKKKKLRSLQRSLNPHLDCCPDTFCDPKHAKTTKWRPIQCFVSLTDNLEPHTGGFEAVLGGFHRSFDDWARNRTPQPKPNEQQQ